MTRDYKELKSGLKFLQFVLNSNEIKCSQLQMANKEFRKMNKIIDKHKPLSTSDEIMDFFNNIEKKDYTVNDAISSLNRLGSQHIDVNDPDNFNYPQWLEDWKCIQNYLNKQKEEEQNE